MSLDKTRRYEAIKQAVKDGADRPLAFDSLVEANCLRISVRGASHIDRDMLDLLKRLLQSKQAELLTELVEMARQEAVAEAEKIRLDADKALTSLERAAS